MPAAPVSLFAVVVANTVTNIIVTAAITDFPNLVGPLPTPGGFPTIGSTTSNAGQTWTPPVLPPDFSPQITGAIATHLATIEAFLVVNPTGAILTAAQVAVVARMLAGFARILLNLTSTQGQAT